MSYTAAVITVSDLGSQGLRQDTSGPAVCAMLEGMGFSVVHTAMLPDEAEQISAELRACADEKKIGLIVTTGGTGLSPRDVTPEATLRVCDRQVPGIAEAMRVRTAEKAPRSMLSRGVAVTRGQTLIVNFPGSPKAVRECMDIVLPVLKHAAAVLKGTVSECAAPV